MLIWRGLMHNSSQPGDFSFRKPGLHDRYLPTNRRQKSQISPQPQRLLRLSSLLASCSAWQPQKARTGLIGAQHKGHREVTCHDTFRVLRHCPFFGACTVTKGGSPKVVLVSSIRNCPSFDQRHALNICSLGFHDGWVVRSMWAKSSRESIRMRATEPGPVRQARASPT